MTPAEESGIREGDVVWCNQENIGRGIYTLFRDDDTINPLFKLVNGHCEYRNADGEKGAYFRLKYVFNLSRMTMKSTRLSLSELRRVKKMMREYTNR